MVFSLLAEQAESKESPAASVRFFQHMKTSWWIGLAVAQVSLGLAAHAEDRVRLTVEHVDLRVVYQPEDATNKLALVVRDDDHAATYLSNQVALVVAESARLELPGDLPPLGNTGEPLWILPQTQDPALLYLGLSTEGVSPAVFPEGVALYLRAVQGPGHAFAWQAGLGGLEVQFNSRDGFDDSDRIALPAGSHSHWNFGFTSNGVYELVFEVQGRRTGVETNDFSRLTPIRFEVEPLPTEPERPFALWQRAQWPGVSDPAIIGPDADPDGDGIRNVVEYALGLNPHVPGRDGLPQPRVVGQDGERRARLEFQHPRAATDVTFVCWKADTLSAPNWAKLTGPQTDSVTGDVESLFFDAGPLSADAACFLRLEVMLEL
jgi:hypothetical protein